MLGNTNYADESRVSGDLVRLAPAVAVVVMTVASWVGVLMVFQQAARTAPSVPVTSVETIYDSMAGR